MNKPETVQKLRDLLGLEPQPEQGGVVHFIKNDILICSVSGGDVYATVLYNNGGTNPDYCNWEGLKKRFQKKIEFADKIGQIGDIEDTCVLTDFDYCPGDKWECGELNLKATTSLGELVWEEIVPGPRHSEDHHEITVTLNGVKIDLYEYDLDLDFEPPGKSGKWADQFAESSDEVEETLQAWFRENKKVLAVLISS